ncbi:NAD(P)-binding protein [Vibrio taketomensis]|uniref:NAD(P)-binding protein n=1 Tax=Vibrio taketomensis TaxID=2572923 RepID=UPI0018D61F87|nr:NAD(P)-binding protein [Vibrio taketomensis]
MDKVKYLIVGGGVSGLAFANFVESEDYLIIEKEAELGGYCRTIYQDGFVWDFAGHFFILLLTS